jgi:hypothetical protein
MNENNKPVAKIVHGGVQIAIWAKDGKFGTFYSLTPSYSYKKDSEWQSSRSFPEDAALSLSKAFLEAYDAIRTLRSEEAQRV